MEGADRYDLAEKTSLFLFYSGLARIEHTPFPVVSLAK